MYRPIISEVGLMAVRIEIQTAESSTSSSARTPPKRNVEYKDGVKTKARYRLA